MELSTVILMLIVASNYLFGNYLKANIPIMWHLLNWLLIILLAYMAVDYFKKRK
ncbi:MULTISPECIES: hypothetical protein [unclassified Facklamia]|uniref:hypothetical protein n=1 Tax=Aerococcaceae TaxID=186827 RepID=UPI0013B5C407|nr:MULTISPECIES: hypothetical protein [unclassified Facklamia]NEW63577.1 hypothetical protein [Facklamia sp. 252]NEW67048.1 hypothetical protein [Facklamia sp. 253]QQD66405.1 hypothetical protein JDW14_04730 [Aerococcaceae bacterium zg-252]